MPNPPKSMQGMYQLGCARKGWHHAAMGAFAILFAGVLEIPTQNANAQAVFCTYMPSSFTFSGAGGTQEGCFQGQGPNNCLIHLVSSTPPNMDIAQVIPVANQGQCGSSAVPFGVSVGPARYCGIVVAMYQGNNPGPLTVTQNGTGAPGCSGSPIASLSLSLSSATVEPSNAYPLPKTPPNVNLVTATATLKNGSNPYTGQTISFSATPISLMISGHLHTDTSSLLQGAFEDDSSEFATQCTTDSNGQCSLSYLAPEVSGAYQVNAAFSPQVQAAQPVNVIIGSLVPMSTPGPYTLTGSYPGVTSQHSDTHNATQLMVNKVNAMAAQYKMMVRTGGYLGINDMSLPWGGLLDITNNWLEPHNLHRAGTSVDVDHTEQGLGSGSCVGTQTTNCINQQLLNGFAAGQGLIRIPEGPVSIHYELR